MMDNHIVTQKRPSLEEPFSVSSCYNHSRGSIGLRTHSLHGAELNQSLEQSRFTCCRYIIPQKTPAQNVSVHNGCRGIDVSILYQIKKAPANARASTTTTMMSELWSVGRWYTPFYFIVFVVLIKRMNRMMWYDGHSLIDRLLHSDDFQTHQCS